MTQYLNFYRHTNCQIKPRITWCDEHDSKWIDKCPACGTPVAPYRSQILEEKKEQKA